MHKTILSFVLFFTFVLPVCTTAQQQQSAGSARPNILIITVDTLRADYLGSYGNHAVATPQIDTLAADGVLFLRCTAHCPVTLPSHTSIFTGTTPAVHGVHDNSGFRVGREITTLAELLSQNGYRTAAFVSAFVLDSRFGLNQGFKYYDDFINPTYGGPYYAERPAGETVAAAREWLNESAPGSKPWAIWIHLFDPHAPYSPPPPFDKKFLRNPYAGEVSYVDSALAPFFDDLEKRGSLDRTVVVITSDHGEGLGEHGEATHGIFAYNSTLHVPLIIRAPNLPKGIKVDRRVRHIDVMPTILELAGITIPVNIEGESLVSLMNGLGSPDAPDSYFEALQGWLALGWAPLRGVYRGNSKFIELPDAELYDMQSDWTEKKNLIGSKAQDARASVQWLKTYLEGNDYSGRRQLEDEDTLEKLKSLGYLTTSAPPNAGRIWTRDDDPKVLYPLERKVNEAKLMDPRTKGAEAERILRDAIKRRPTMFDAYEALALNLVARGRGDDAIALLRTAIEAGIRDRVLIKSYADTLYSLAKPSEALEIYRSLEIEDPQDAEIASLVGVCLFALNDLPGAENELRRALELDPTYMQARVSLAGVLLTQGTPKEAEKVIDAAINLWPEFAPAQELKGVILQNRGDLAGAREHYSLALEARPTHHSARYRLALVLIALKEKQEAINTIRDFLKSAPRDQFPQQHNELNKLLQQLQSKK